MLQLEKVTVIDASFRLHIASYSKKSFLWNAWNVLTRLHRRKKKKKYDTFCTSLGRDDQIAIPVSYCVILAMQSLMDSVVI